MAALRVSLFFRTQKFLFNYSIRITKMMKTPFLLLLYIQSDGAIVLASKFVQALLGSKECKNLGEYHESSKTFKSCSRLDFML